MTSFEYSDAKAFKKIGPKAPVTDISAMSSDNIVAEKSKYLRQFCHELHFKHFNCPACRFSWHTQHLRSWGVFELAVAAVISPPLISTVTPQLSSSVKQTVLQLCTRQPLRIKREPSQSRGASPSCSVAPDSVSFEGRPYRFMKRAVSPKLGHLARVRSRVFPDPDLPIPSRRADTL